MQIKVQKPK